MHYLTKQTAREKKRSKSIKLWLIEMSDFLEARKIVEKWSQPWRSNPAFSSGAESLIPRVR
jgi:hypothetical protein